MDDHHIEVETPWLMAKVDQRLALIVEGLGGNLDAFKNLGTTTIVTPLCEPKEDTEKGVYVWENSCDGCDAFLGSDALTMFHAFRQKGEMKFVFTLGVCEACTPLVQQP
jgi:hypothetical protein